MLKEIEKIGKIIKIEEITKIELKKQKWKSKFCSNNKADFGEDYVLMNN